MTRTRTSRNRRRRKNHEKKNHGNRTSPIESATVHSKTGSGKIETGAIRIAIVRSSRIETGRIKIVIVHSKIAIGRIVSAHGIKSAISRSATIAIASKHKSAASTLDGSLPAVAVAFLMIVSGAASAANTPSTCSAAGVEEAEANAFNIAGIGSSISIHGPVI